MKNFITVLCIGLLIPNISLGQSKGDSEFAAIKKIMTKYYVQKSNIEQTDSIKWVDIDCVVKVDTIHTYKCINAEVSYSVLRNSKLYETHCKNWWFDKTNKRYAYLSDFRQYEPYGAMPSRSFTTGGFHWVNIEKKDSIVQNVFNLIRTEE